MSTRLMNDIEIDINPALIIAQNTPKLNSSCVLSQRKFIKLIHHQDIQGMSLCEKWEGKLLMIHLYMSICDKVDYDDKCNLIYSH